MSSPFASFQRRGNGKVLSAICDLHVKCQYKARFTGPLYIALDFLDTDGAVLVTTTAQDG